MTQRLPVSRRTGRSDPKPQRVFVDGDRTGRADPKPRHIDAVTPWGSLVNKDPNREYVYANARAQGMAGSVDWYRMLGYRLEKYKKGGVLPAGFNAQDEDELPKEGEPLIVMGCAVMSVSKERKAELDQVGFDGNGGQQHVDRIESEILDRESGGIDESRGLYGYGDKYMRVENDTKSPWKPVGEGAEV